MDSSPAMLARPSSVRSALRGRLLIWAHGQFVAEKYGDLAACQLGFGRMNELHAQVADGDDLRRTGVSFRERVVWQVSELSNPAELPVLIPGQQEVLAVDVLPVADEWIRRLSTHGRTYDDAVAQLHELLLRAVRSQVSRMREGAVLGSVRREEIIHSAADEATMSVLSKLSTFEGRSAFTTWAYKFGILQAGNEIRREAWRDREINLEDVPEQPQKVAPSPETYAEGRDLAHAVRVGLREALTPHQRRVAVAVLIDEVPIDVLAERLGMSRNSLYKTLHDARQRLRAHLSDRDFLLPTSGRKEVTG
ncbi:MAG: sigma-70 family RNA polymerase sigma factor [Terrimesophilobacter sp.]